MTEREKRPELYASWVKGLPQDKEALGILRRSGVIAGIEMGNLDPQVEMVQGAGLGFSAHTPGMDLTLNLASPRTLLNAFGGEQRQRLLEVIRKSNPPIVGFHLGYSATEVVKMNAYPNVAEPGTIITDRPSLLAVLASAIKGVEGVINSELPDESKKRILLETLDHSREGQKPDWGVQRDDVKPRQEELEEIIEQYGINAGLLHVTDPDFVNDLFGALTQSLRVGFLFDVAHTFISADSKIHDREFSGTTEEYFQKTLEATGSRTYQIHINVPGGNKENGYADHHRLFGDDELSQRVMDLTKWVYQETKNNLLVATLEMRTNLPPVEHANEMVRQGERFIRYIENIQEI